MASSRLAGSYAASADEEVRVYCLCFFDPGSVVPAVELLDAGSDVEAVALARNRRPAAAKELWDHHRLVARMRPGMTITR